MSTQTPSAPVHVLLVEDDDGDALLLREMLGEAPIVFEVATARYLREALARLDAGGIDVVLSDLTLPDCRGLETFAKLHGHPARRPIIVLSGMDDEDMALRTVEQGAQDYLVKGAVDSALLVRSIRYALKRDEAERALAQERNLLRSVIDNLIDAVFVKDLEGRYVLANAAHIRRLRAKSEEEIVGRTSFDFYAQEVARAFAEDDAHVVRTGLAIVNRHEYTGGPESEGRWLSTTKAPLRDLGGRIVGVVGIGSDITARKLADEKLKRSTRELKDKNSQLEDDLNMAREVQQAFLPQQFPSFPRTATPAESALRFFSRYLPTATLGGDFFHVQPISDTEAGVFICDVMGHGVRAALLTAIERTLVEELTDAAREPGRFLTEMNASLLAILRRTNSPTFASAFYCVADVAAGVLRYANAGHPAPLHLRREARALERLDAGGARPGPALGVLEQTVYATHETRLAPRDMVLLFTDGLYEVENARGEFFDPARFPATVERHLHRGAEEIFERTLAEVRAFAGREDFIDDVCLVAMEVQHLASQQEDANASTPIGGLIA